MRRYLLCMVILTMAFILFARPALADLEFSDDSNHYAIIIPPEPEEDEEVSIFFFARLLGTSTIIGCSGIAGGISVRFYCDTVWSDFWNDYYDVLSETDDMTDAVEGCYKFAHDSGSYCDVKCIIPYYKKPMLKKNEDFEYLEHECDDSKKLIRLHSLGSLGLSEGEKVNAIQSPSDEYDIDNDNIADIFEDEDGDGIIDKNDNCPYVANEDQLDEETTCGGVMGTQPDGVGSACDNCPLHCNQDQANNDGDSMGDKCDPDDDNDGILDVNDNCKLVANPDQADGDLDGIGNACDKYTQYKMDKTPPSPEMEGGLKMEEKPDVPEKQKVRKKSIMVTPKSTGEPVVPRN